MTPPRDHHRRTFLRASSSALVAVGVAGCMSSGSASERTVKMAGSLAFDPETVTVAVGGTVEWTNESDVKHTVTAYEERIPDEAEYFASGGFESEEVARSNLSGGLLTPGETYEHTFEHTGTHEYYCIPHEGSGMVGTVRVE